MCLCVDCLCVVCLICVYTVFGFDTSINTSVERIKHTCVWFGVFGCHQPSDPFELGNQTDDRKDAIPNSFQEERL